MGNKRGRKAVQAKDAKEAEKKKEAEESSEDDVIPENSNSEEQESDSEDYDISDSEEEDGDDDDDEKEVNVDFEFFDPKTSDFHGVRSLLQNYLDGATFTGLSELTDTIVEQSTVGTVVRTSEDEAPVGIVSVLNLHQKQDLTCVREILDHIKSKCNGNKAIKKKLEKAVSSEKTGLVVSERLLNCPPELSDPVVTALFDEITWATEDEPTEEKRESFRFDQYLIFTRLFKEKPGEKRGGMGDEVDDETAPGPSKKKQKKAEKKEPVAKGEVEEELTFVRLEDEVFHQFCSWFHTWNVENKPVSGTSLKPMRMVMLLEASNMAFARKKIKEMVDAV